MSAVRSEHRTLNASACSRASLSGRRGGCATGAFTGKSWVRVPRPSATSRYPSLTRSSTLVTSVALERPVCMQKSPIETGVAILFRKLTASESRPRSSPAVARKPLSVRCTIAASSNVTSRQEQAASIGHPARHDSIRQPRPSCPLSGWSCRGAPIDRWTDRPECLRSSLGVPTAVQLLRRTMHPLGLFRPAGAPGYFHDR